MRKTTTSLAIFCSAVALSVVPACGKRGDPLPPLRPFPAAAEGLTIRQIGDRIELEWRAPTRNTDGTTDKLELAEVEVRRRIIDLAALVEAQTKTVEPEANDPAQDELDPTSAAPGTDAASDPTPAPTDADPPADAPPLPTLTPETETDPETETETTQTTDNPPKEETPQTPPLPQLVIPAFSPDSRDVTTLDSIQPGETVTFEEDIDPTWIDKRVEYAVVYINRSNRRGPRTTSVQIDPIAALQPPEQPSVETGDGFVTLTWNPPQPDSHFSIYRRQQDRSDYPNTPLNPTPIPEPKFEDRTIKFHAESCYTVRTVPEPPPPPPPDPLDPLPPNEGTPVIRTDILPNQTPVPVPDTALPPNSASQPAIDPETDPTLPTIVIPEIPPIKNRALILSLPSPEICVTPVDTFPPPPPTGLVAVRSGQDVLLTWTDVDRPDVVGYRLYRSRDDDGPFELLTDDILRVPSYTDDSVESGEYFYAVTAVDDAPVANESIHSELSEVTFTP